MIPIKNVYYMLTYTFQILNEKGFKSIETEKFENAGDLMATILLRGMNVLLKRGFERQYISHKDELSTLRGKINVNDTVVKQTHILKKKIICEFDEFDLNCDKNRIIKSTLTLLLKFNIQKSIKKDIKKILVYFKDIDLIDLNNVNWNMHYNRNNQIYKMLISICYLVYKGLIQTNNKGSYKLMDYIEDKYMHKIYEKFILNYYKKEFANLDVSSSQIKWQLDDDYKTMLPIMQSDIMLKNKQNNKILIIDAKYYTKLYQLKNDNYSIHSNNLYQIFTYVKNKNEEVKDINYSVSGMLLYAKTNEEKFPDNDYKMSGNLICVKTLDLSLDFNLVKNQLNNIVEKYLY